MPGKVDQDVDPVAPYAPRKFRIRQRGNVRPAVGTAAQAARNIIFYRMTRIQAGFEPGTVQGRKKGLEKMRNRM